MSQGEFPLSSVPPGTAIDVGDCAVFNVGSRLCATQARCTHRGGRLSQGRLDGSTVTCPIHGAQFDVTTGAVLRGPAQEPLKTYPIAVEGSFRRIEQSEVTA